jgi:hypothetical protein
VLKHGPEDGDTATRESDESLGVVFPFAALSVVEVLRQRVLDGDGAEGALVEDAFERLVASEGAAPAVAFSGLALDGREAGGGGQRIGRSEAPDVPDTGDEPCREHRPHPRQRTDEGAIRVVGQQHLQIAVDPGDLLSRLERLDGQFADQFGGGGLAGHDDLLRACGLQRAIGQRVDSVQTRGLLQMGNQAGLAGTTDLGGRDEAGEQRQRSLAGYVERPLKARKDAAQEPTQAGQAAGLVLGQIAATTDLEPERDDRVLIRQDRAQIAGAHQLGDGARVPRIGLALAPREAMTGPVDRDARRMDEGKPFGQQHRLEETCERSHHVKADHHIAAETAQLRDQRVDPSGVVLDRAVENDLPAVIDRHGPMDRLGRIDPDAYLHCLASILSGLRRPRHADIALHSHRGHRVISGRSRAARRAAQPPEPARTAAMTAIPTLPAPQQLLTAYDAGKRGKAQ